MAFELDDESKRKLDELCRYYAVLQLRLFGSATSDDFDPTRSDLDFLVLFDKPPLGMKLRHQFFGLIDELQSLFGRSIDLLEENAIENSYLRQSAEASAVTLYAA